MNIEENFRQKGIGKKLLNAVLDDAWTMGAQHVRWTVDYENLAGISLYCSIGAALIPEEDSGSDKPLQKYTVVMQRPNCDE